MMYLIDTNVISEARKMESGKADRRVHNWVESVSATSLYLSVISVMELEKGALLLERRDSKQGGMLLSWLDAWVLPSFSGRILPVDTAVARRCAALHVPAPRADRDALIAATALANEMQVVTRNTQDFVPMGVKVFNPWEYQG